MRVENCAGITAGIPLHHRICLIASAHRAVRIIRFKSNADLCLNYGFVVHDRDTDSAQHVFEARGKSIQATLLVNGEPLPGIDEDEDNPFDHFVDGVSSALVKFALEHAGEDKASGWISQQCEQGAHAMQELQALHASVSATGNTKDRQRAAMASAVVEAHLHALLQLQQAMPRILMPAGQAASSRQSQ